MTRQQQGMSARARVSDIGNSLVALVTGRSGQRSGTATEELPRTHGGGATGTPSHDPDEAPPSLDQESNWTVSGGGVVSDRGDESEKARRSR